MPKKKAVGNSAAAVPRVVPGVGSEPPNKKPKPKTPSDGPEVMKVDAIFSRDNVGEILEDLGCVSKTPGRTNLQAAWRAIRLKLPNCDYELIKDARNKSGDSFVEMVAMEIAERARLRKYIQPAWWVEQLTLFGLEDGRL
jgi:hypothetical protein